MLHDTRLFHHARPPLRVDFLSGPLICLLLSVSLSGCVSVHWRDANGTVQHRGTLRYSVIHTDSAHIFVQETIGLDLRLAFYDPGVSLGYRKYIAVRPKPAGIPAGEESGYFSVEDPVSEHAGLYFKKVYGGDLGFNLISNGLTLGYDRITVIVGPKNQESATRQIDFSEDALHATRYLQR